MKRPLILSKELRCYLLKFIGFFCLLYFGTIAIIGLSTPGGYYSSFVQHYLDYVSLLRLLILHASKFFITLAGYKCDISGTYRIDLVGGRGVRLVYTCLGYGVMSFWTAFVFANKAGWWKKTFWIIFGCILICCINIARISFLLLAINKNKRLPFNLDHHTLFNIAAYITIFILIYFFDRSQKNSSILTSHQVD